MSRVLVYSQADTNLNLPPSYITGDYLNTLHLCILSICVYFWELWDRIKETWVRAPSNGPNSCFMSKKLYPDCLVLVGSRNGF